MVADVEVRAIVPTKDVVDLELLERNINRAYDRFEGVLRNDMNRAVGTWKKKPTFRYTRKRRGNTEILTVETDDPRWKWIDQGTKPHPIYPRRAKKLRFRSGYSPATASNRIIARQAKSFGKVVFSDGVQHPGIKPRNLNRRIQARNQKKFIVFMSDAQKGITDGRRR